MIFPQCTNEKTYFDFDFLLYKTIKIDIKTAPKIINNLIMENLLPLKVSSLRQDGWYLGITNLC